MRAARGRGVVVCDCAEPEGVLRLGADCRPAALQLHGGQGPAFVVELVAGLAAAGLQPAPEVWGVLSMPAEAAEARGALRDLTSVAQSLGAAGAAKVVLDSQVAGKSGGTGVPVNWQLAAELVAQCPVPVLIAGGITPGNALEALQATGAAGVDVSSGVELRPGVKSASRVRELMEVLRSPVA